MVDFQVESFVTALPDIRLMVDDHWSEVGSFKDEFDRDIDYEAYIRLESEQRLLTITGRDEGDLVGYFVGVLGSDLHRVNKSDPPRRAKVLSALVYYMVPERRGHARSLIREVERQAAARDVQIVNIRVKPGLNSADAFFDRLGYGIVEVTRTKLIGDAAHARERRPKVA